MSEATQNLGGVGRKEAVALEPISSYERLRKLRDESPDKFLLLTSEVSRAGARPTYTAS